MRILFADIITKISKDDVLNLYINQNLSQHDCAEHFGITIGMFNHILKYYDIHKDAQLHNILIEKSKLERYGDSKYNNRDDAKKTCLEKYGVDNIFKDTEKMKQSYMEKLNCDHPMHNKEIAKKCKEHHNYNESINKGKQTYYDRTGFDNPAKNPESLKKGIQTKIANGVFDSPHESNIERRLEKLLNRKFDNVKSHYRDERYARDSGYQFECDFYIPEQDLFVELNAHWTHGNHPYNPNSEADRQILESYISKNKPWCVSFINTWTVRDVEKQTVAKNANLNYIILYPTSTISENIKFNDKKYKELVTYLIKKLNEKTTG